MIASEVSFHLAGIVQAALFLLSITALYVQLQTIRHRRSGKIVTNEPATENLSFIALMGSFLAFFSFFLVSAVTVPFASYIYWTRIPACLLALLLLEQLTRDRPALKYRAAFTGGTFSFVLFLILSLWDRELLFPLKHPFEILVLIAGFVLLSGQVHQLQILIRTQRLGALSLKARALNLCKDLSTVAFGLVLGTAQSWSFMTVAGLNALVTTVVLSYGGRLAQHLKR